MAGYGWDEFDTRRGGVQSIHDAENKLDITTSFVKVPGGKHGGSWAARIKGTLRENAPEDLKTMLMLYVTQEGSGSVISPAEADDEMGYSGDVILKGQSEDLGDYKLVVTRGEGERPTSEHELSEFRDLEKTVMQSLTLPEEIMWQAKPIVFRQMKEGVEVASFQE